MSTADLILKSVEAIFTVLLSVSTTRAHLNNQFQKAQSLTLFAILTLLIMHLGLKP